jgi:hypothetical protein
MVVNIATAGWEKVEEGVRILLRKFDVPPPYVTQVIRNLSKIPYNLPKEWDSNTDLEKLKYFQDNPDLNKVFKKSGVNLEELIKTQKVLAKNSSESEIEEFFTLSPSVGFKITEQSLENLKSEGVPDDVLEKLQSLKNQEFIGEENFLDKLEETIGDEQTVKFKSSILKHAESRFLINPPWFGLLGSQGKVYLAWEEYKKSPTLSEKMKILQKYPELEAWIVKPSNDWDSLTIDELISKKLDAKITVLATELDATLATLATKGLDATLATRLENIEKTFATLATKEELKNLEQAISTKLDAQVESDRKEFERIGKDVDELKQTIATKEKELEDIKQASTTFATKAEIGRLEQTIISTQSIINDDIDARLNQTNIKLSTINATMDANNASIDAKFKTVDSRFDSLEKRISATSFWMKFYGGVLTIALILDIALH